MTWLQFVNDFHIWWIIVTFIVSTIFVVYYGLCAPWYKTPFGRALMTVDAGIAVTLFPGVMKYGFNYNIYNGKWDTVVTMVALSAVTVAILYRIGVLFSVRHLDKWRKLDARRTAERVQEREDHPTGSEEHL